MHALHEDMEPPHAALSPQERALRQAISRIAEAPPPRSSVDYALARVSCSLSHGPEGATLKGWIDYGEGDTLPFTASAFGRQEGLPIDMVGGHPDCVALRRHQLAGRAGCLMAVGVGGAGVATLLLQGRMVTLPNFPLRGVGHGPWRVDALLRFGR